MFGWTRNKHSHRHEAAPMSPVVAILVEDLERGSILWEGRYGCYGALVGVQTLPDQKYWASISGNEVRMGESLSEATDPVTITRAERKRIEKLVMKQLDKAASERERLRSINNANAEQRMADKLMQLRGQ